MRCTLRRAVIAAAVLATVMAGPPAHAAPTTTSTGSIQGTVTKDGQPVSGQVELYDADLVYITAAAIAADGGSR